MSVLYSKINDVPIKIKSQDEKKNFTINTRTIPEISSNLSL